jgi:hypothetical protein
VPSQLVRILTDVLWAAAELREVLNVDVTPELWQVLLNHAQPEWVLPPSSSGALTAAASGGAMVPWLPQVSSAGQPLSPFSGSAGGDLGSSAGGSGGCVNEGGDCPTGGVPIEVFGMVQALGEWYVQVRRGPEALSSCIRMLLCRTAATAYVIVGV